MNWRAEVGRLFGAESPLTPQSRNLKPYIDVFALSRQPFDDLVDGVEMDLRRSRYETIDELIGYCRRVASAVGVMCIEVFGCRDSRSREYAFNLGLALQLTNIIRDIKADLKQGRVYLPQEDLARFGVGERGACRRRDDGRDQEAAGLRMPARPAVLCAAAQAMPHAESRKLVAAEIMGAHLFRDPAAHRAARLRRVQRAGSRAETAARPDSAAHLGPVAAVRIRFDTFGAGLNVSGRDRDWRRMRRLCRGHRARRIRRARARPRSAAGSRRPRHGFHRSRDRRARRQRPAHPDGLLRRDAGVSRSHRRRRSRALAKRTEVIDDRSARPSQRAGAAGAAVAAAFSCRDTGVGRAQLGASDCRC